MLYFSLKVPEKSSTHFTPFLHLLHCGKQKNPNVNGKHTNLKCHLNLNLKAHPALLQIIIQLQCQTVVFNIKLLREPTVVISIFWEILINCKPWKSHSPHTRIKTNTMLKLMNKKLWKLVYETCVHACIAVYLQLCLHEYTLESEKCWKKKPQQKTKQKLWEIKVCEITKYFFHF